ncbi:MAG TPA: UTP--glucose-1-phosphate uridylyltransferase GalU [Candidatus Ruthenibacterium merdavium]|uniref:UTP--glucose-1-phosphate uridylyltransferase n=1 Tax=Candidatus Ruthenibacterium merdavium TaxID=2838752 RepID=A0A9D2TKH2_9FIRM|nr:UTP--glucose-1-phosphate uridylyltransferase GalU [Candidatus Ruthenibacterium merdavium]
MKKVRKAIIPAAGLGTRVLPATKAMPKEMLPIVDKPAIQYIVEEAVQAGIEEILIITGRGKSIMEDHFDHAFELESALSANPAKHAMLEECLSIANMADIYFIRQKETKGLGHAVLKARGFTKDEPFVVMYGDDVIMGEDPVAAQLMRAYEQTGKACVGIKEVTPEQIQKYSSMKCDLIKDNLYNITDMIEKPKPGQEFSMFSILGRCLLTPEIYEILDRTAPGAGGEIQLTDAMAEVARKGGMTGVDFTGKRYDMGAKLGVMEAQVETALRHPEIGEAFRAYLKELCKTL